MLGHGKKVKYPQFCQREATGGQILEVPGKRGGVTRHVHDAARAPSHQGLGHTLGETTAGRVRDDDVPLAHGVVDRTRRDRPLADLEVAKPFSVLSRVTNGVGRGLDGGDAAPGADDFREWNGEQSDATEEVCDVVIDARVSRFENRVEQHRRRVAVRLPERPRTDGKDVAANPPPRLRRWFEWLATQRTEFVDDAA